MASLPQRSPLQVHHPACNTEHWQHQGAQCHGDSAWQAEVRSHVQRVNGGQEFPAGRFRFVTLIFEDGAV